MSTRRKRIVAGGVIGISYLLVTVFYVYAASGFTVNLGIFLALALNAHTAILSELFSVAPRMSASVTSEASISS